MSEALGKNMVSDLTPKVAEMQDAFRETQDKFKKWEQFGHRLGTALQTIEWNMQQALEKGRVDTKINEKLMQGILNTPGWAQLLEQLMRLGRQIEDLQTDLYAKGKLDINKPGILGDGYKKFLEKIPSFLATQQQAKKPSDTSDVAIEAANWLKAYSPDAIKKRTALSEEQ